MIGPPSAVGGTPCKNGNSASGNAIAFRFLIHCGSYELEIRTSTISGAGAEGASNLPSHHPVLALDNAERTEIFREFWKFAETFRQDIGSLPAILIAAAFGPVSASHP